MVQMFFEIHLAKYDDPNLIFADGSPGGIKVILNALGICGTTVRMPLHDVSESVRKQLLESMKQIGAQKSA